MPDFSTLVDAVRWIIDFILHVDDHLQEIIASYGAWTYFILFLIVFCETGLIVTPYLPGDSLLFAAGAFAGMGHFELPLLMTVLIFAAVIGDMVNFWLARAFRQKLNSPLAQRFIKEEHLARTQAFFDKHGAKTIVLARFVPIVRTFAPFVAGVGAMRYRRFVAFNIIGALLWVGIFVPAGYFFGNIPAVRENFTLVIFGIIGVSLLPIVFEFLRHRFGSAKVGQTPSSPNSYRKSP